ncbi:hypothetical protein DL96DRAFT_1750288 [Flagelloscypha sp. PMI_526]|nr:hypothetical protein DL96DRAFT_1750288 [Flagelloscypha sp. PMI_526]
MAELPSKDLTCSHEFPPEVVHRILGSLKCVRPRILQSRQPRFPYHLKRDSIFFRLVLCAKTWRAKCSFLLGQTGARFCPRVKNLTLRLAGIPGTDSSDIPLDPNFSAFIQKVGPQLERLSLDGMIDRHSWLAWKDDDLLQTDVLPYIRSLAIRNFNSLPLLNVLSHCRRVQNLVVSAQFGSISPQEAAALKMEFLRVSKLSIAAFTTGNFELATHLGQYINHSNCKVSCLEIRGHSRQYFRTNFPLHLGFLPPMESLKSSVQHLSFGLDIYDSIGESILVILQLSSSLRNTNATTVRDYEDDDVPSLLPLPKFPQLHILSLHMRLISVRSFDNWMLWFKWVARNLLQSSLPPNLDTLGLIVHDVDNAWMVLPYHRSKSVEQFAVIPPIRLEAVLKSNGQYPQRAQKAIGLLRNLLQAWEDAGKFSIWLSYV